jgi:hypothetical protein
MRRTTCSVVIRRVPAVLVLFVVGEDIRPARQGQVNDAVHCLHHLASTQDPLQETSRQPNFLLPVCNITLDHLQLYAELFGIVRQRGDEQRRDVEHL